MKRFLILLLSMMMVLSSTMIFACNSSKPPVEVDVVLVDIGGLETYDLLDGIPQTDKGSISGKQNLSYVLTSVPTGETFTFYSSEINLQDIRKEHYMVEIFEGEDKLFSIGYDFFDMAYDGVVWCNWDESLKGAIVSRTAKDEPDFRFIEEEIANTTSVYGNILVLDPTNECFNLFAIKPFHSKKYYQEFAEYGVLNISFIRRAVYSKKNSEFKPDEIPAHANHKEGEYAEPGTTINFKRFAYAHNESSIASRLNVWQEIDYQMMDIINNFEKIGDSKKGAEFWYLLGTCHYGAGNPYDITFYVNAIDIFV